MSLFYKENLRGIRSSEEAALSESSEFTGFLADEQVFFCIHSALKRQNLGNMCCKDILNFFFLISPRHKYNKPVLCESGTCKWKHFENPRNISTVTSVVTLFVFLTGKVVKMLDALPPRGKNYELKSMLI